jgi:hypothetical protein
MNQVKEVMKQSIAAALLALMLAFVALGQPVLAGIKDNPPPQPGWTHSPPFSPDDSPQRHGVLLSGGAVERSSPVIAEVDGNPGNGREVVVAGRDGRIYTYRANGSLLWEKDAPNRGCASVSVVVGKASVGAIYGDGQPYVVIGYGPIENTNRACYGGIVVYRGSDGQEAWRFSLQAFEAQTPEGPEELHAVIAAPALADTDGDGRMEIAFGGFDRNVYLLNADGSLRWYYHAADTVWASPLFMNIDGDPELELIVATDISANGQLIPPTQDGGFLHAFDTQPRNPTRINFQTGFLWRTAFDQVLFSSPLAADLLDSNPGREIAIGSGCFFPTGSNDKRGRWIKIVRPSDGAVLQTLNAPACVQSSPAVGDIDDDGQLEIVATVSGAPEIGGDGKSRIVAWDPTNPNPKWATAPGDPNSGSNDAFGGDLQSAVIADLDGNGSLEVITANFWSVHVLNGSNGVPLTCQGPSCGGQLSLFAWYTLKSTPAVGDLDGDGDLEVVIGGSHINNQSRGLLYAWTDFAGRLNSPAGNQSAYSAPWPQFRRDAQANGVFALPGLAIASNSVGLLLERGDTRAGGLTVTSGDGSAVSWTAVETSDPSDILRLNNDSGGSGQRVTFTLEGNQAPGSYSASFELRAQGLPSVPVTIRLRVADNVIELFLPIGRR